MKNNYHSKFLLIFISMLFVHTSFCQSAFNDKENIAAYEIKTESERAAYKSKVASKLEDFYNYLQIIANPSVEKKLREHTVDLTQKLFSEDVEIIDLLSSSKESILLSAFLQSLLKSKTEVAFIISDINSGIDGPEQLAKYDIKIEQNGLKQTHKVGQLFTISLLDKKFGSKTKKVTVITLGKIFE